MDGIDSSMKKDVCVALDVMGGDHGPEIVVPAAAIALERRPDLAFVLYGDEKNHRAAAFGDARRSPRSRASFIATSRSR